MMQFYNCPAFYEPKVDNSENYCTLALGHDGPHESVIDGEIVKWEDE